MELSKILKLKDKLERDMMKVIYKFEKETKIICRQVTIYNKGYNGGNSKIYIKMGR